MNRRRERCATGGTHQEPRRERRHRRAQRGPTHPSSRRSVRASSSLAFCRVTERDRRRPCCPPASTPPLSVAKPRAASAAPLRHAVGRQALRPPPKDDDVTEGRDGAMTARLRGRGLRVVAALSITNAQRK